VSRKVFVNYSIAVVDTDESYPFGQCQLVDEQAARCAAPVTPPPVDELGRRRGGRKSKYCSKAHADKASRLQRSTAAAGTGEGLRRATELADRLVPALREQERAVTSLRAVLEQVDAGAISRVEAAESDADQARRDATLAGIRMGEAERRAAADRTVTEQATTARAAAEQARQQAAERERAAVARADAAETRVETAASNERAARLALGESTELLGATKESLAAADRDRAALGAESHALRAALAELTAVRDTTATENARLAAELSGARDELIAVRVAAAGHIDDARAKVARADSAAQAARVRVEAITAEMLEARSNLAAAAAAHRSVAELTAQQLLDARAEAAQQRERAAAAELLLHQESLRVTPVEGP